MTASFFVPGIPRPQGSKTAIGRLVGGKVKTWLVEGRRANARAEFKQWRELVAHHAEVYVQATNFTCIPRPVPVSMSLAFALPRPGTHLLRDGKHLSAVGRRITHPSSRPDLDKLARAVLDALTEVLFDDDSQVCSISLLKVYETDSALSGVQVNCKRLTIMARA